MPVFLHITRKEMGKNLNSGVWFGIFLKCPKFRFAMLKSVQFGSLWFRHSTSWMFDNDDEVSG